MQPEQITGGSKTNEVPKSEVEAFKAAGGAGGAGGAVADCAELINGSKNKKAGTRVEKTIRGDCIAIHYRLWVANLEA
jgi:hypothetical protein